MINLWILMVKKKGQMNIKNWIFSPVFEYLFWSCHYLVNFDADAAVTQGVHANRF